MQAINFFTTLDLTNVRRLQRSKKIIAEYKITTTDQRLYELYELDELYNCFFSIQYEYICSRRVFCGRTAKASSLTNWQASFSLFSLIKIWA